MSALLVSPWFDICNARERWLVKRNYVFKTFVSITRSGSLVTPRRGGDRDAGAAYVAAQMMNQTRSSSGIIQRVRRREEIGSGVHILISDNPASCAWANSLDMGVMVIMGFTTCSSSCFHRITWAVSSLQGTAPGGSCSETEQVSLWFWTESFHCACNWPCARARACTIEGTCLRLAYSSFFCLISSYKHVDVSCMCLLIQSLFAVAEWGEGASRG